MRACRLFAAVLIVLACTAAGAGAAEVDLQIPVTVSVSVDPGKYWFRFDLYRSTDMNDPDAGVWSESMDLAGPKKAISSKKLTHTLGSIVPLHPGLFSEQLWLRVSRMKSGNWVACSQLVKLSVVPYAIWSAGTDQALCYPGDFIGCYTGPAATKGKGICKSGTRTCSDAGSWSGACAGQVLPLEQEWCNQLDDDCDGVTDESAADCGPGETCVGGECLQVEWDCEDGVDNDLDTLVDCADPDCIGQPGCEP